MQKIDIGTIIDLEDLLVSRLLIQGNSGCGKSVLARGIIEQTYGKVPFIVLDIEGEYYTLKEAFGDVLVIGGQHADVPISLKSVKLLPKEIIGNRLSVVIDLSDMQISDRITYAKYFLEALMDLPSQYWINYLVFIEEAHKLCGQQDKYESGPSVKDLMSRGRKRGYCGILLTQRIAKLHKDAAAECNNKFIGRTFQDVDLDRAASELGISSNTEKFKIRDLAPGTFYALGTAIQPHHVHLVKVNMPKTKVVKAGMDMVIKPQKPTAKVLALLTKLNELPAEAEKELKTVQELQKELARVKLDLKNAQGGKQSLTGDITKIQGLQTDLNNALSEKKQLQSQISAYENQFKQANIVVRNFVGLCSKVIDDLSVINFEHLNNLFVPIPIPGRNHSQKPLPVKPITQNTSPSIQLPKPQHPVINTDNNKLGRAEKNIIMFLAQFPQRSFTKVQIGVACGYAIKGGGFNNAISKLNSLGFIIKGDKTSVNADAMSAIIDIVGTIEYKEYGYEHFQNLLSKAEKEIYGVLINEPHRIFSKQELAESTPSNYEPKGGGFNNAISRLNTLELLKKVNGGYQLNQELLEI